jgi:hypothetical protein
MVKAQEWLDSNYPLNNTCQLESDSDNYGKAREEIKELDISHRNLEGELKLERFYNPQDFDCNEFKIYKYKNI